MFSFVFFYYSFVKLIKCYKILFFRDCLSYSRSYFFSMDCSNFPSSCLTFSSCYNDSGRSNHIVQ